MQPRYREMPPPGAPPHPLGCGWGRGADGPGDVRIVPDGCSDLVWRRGEGVTVVGPDTSAKLVPRTPDDLLIGIRFLPGAGGGALGMPLDELRDLRVDAIEVDRSFVLD